MTGSIFVEADQLSVSETDGFVLVTILRSGDLSGAVAIEYSTTVDDATPGLDYETASGTVVMDTGVDRIQVPVPVLDDDLSEPTETFVFTLSNVGSGTLLFPSTARVDILDDENPVQIQQSQLLEVEDMNLDGPIVD